MTPLSLSRALRAIGFLVIGLTCLLLSPAEARAQAAAGPRAGAAVSAAAAGAAVTPRAADAVVADALAEARTAGQGLLIEFGASWCTWCRNFEAFIASPDAGPVMRRHFRVVNLTVRERDEKRALEHPGGVPLMDRWGGEKSGLPFYVFLDQTGRKVGDSNAMPDGSNVGFPAVPDEIAAFMRVIAQAAPAMTDAERTTVRDYLVRVMPPRRQ